MQVLVATMAATATISQGRSIPNYAISAEYPTMYHTEYPSDFVHSLSKRSPVTPFKPVNPIIGVFTFPLPGDIGARKKFNAAVCAVTLCKNKKFGLVI